MACGIGCSLSGTAGNEEVWSTGERGGRVRAGGLAALARPGSGEGRPLLSWLPIPGVGTGTCPDGTERKAGRAWASGRRQEWPALRPGILARLQHRPRRPGIAGTARPSFSVVWRAPGRLGAEPAPDFFRAGDAPRAHDAAIDDHRRGGQHAQGHDLPQVGDFFHRGVTAGSGHPC